MPNFNTHWLVSAQCLDAVPTYIKDGFDEYRRLTEEFGEKLRKAVLAVPRRDDESWLGEESRSRYDTFIEEVYPELLANYESDLKTSSSYDDMTCYAAYCLGACGPDFWTTTSEANYSPKPDTAGIHFDLGHYNRTHAQFEVAIKRWKAGKAKAGLQQRAEVAYFMGMATHIAADLVIHQLVNISAGAYNCLVRDNWENEQGNLTADIWNTHNKVEHFWDSYLRMRYIGDYGPIFGDRDKKDWVRVWKFPLVESLVRDVEATRSCGGRSLLLAWLAQEETRYRIERPQILPRLFCDRLFGGNGISPFIYDVVVEKSNGAYPEKLVFGEAKTEADSYQMTAGGGGKTEKWKARYFTTDANTSNWALGTKGWTYIYLNYYVCPNLDKVKKYCWDVFYHTNALEPFIEGAAKVGRKFVQDFQRAIEAGDPDDLGTLGTFWNLDTGLGLRVVSRPSHTAHEVVTQLDFVNVAELIGTSQVNYSHNSGYTAKMKASKAFSNPTSPPAFKVYASPAFESLEKVSESKDDAYLDMINLGSEKEPLREAFSRGAYFIPAQQAAAAAQGVASKSISASNDVTVRDIKHRLTLRVTTAMAAYPNADASKSAADKAAFYLLGDSRHGLDHPVKFADHRQADWLKEGDTKAREYIEQPKTGQGLCHFEAHILVNLEIAKDLKRKIKAGEWNNVVPFDGKHKEDYARNWAVGTGRAFVLYPTGDGDFWADSDFGYYTNVSPTEHIFFTLYPLVKTKDGVYDMFSKEQVTDAKLDELIKIECLGFVKVVLFYALTKDGGMQLDTCYIDGSEAKVVTVPAEPAESGEGESDVNDSAEGDPFTETDPDILKPEDAEAGTARQ